MLSFMKRFVKVALFGLAASGFSLPSMAESALAGAVSKDVRVAAKLDFSIVVLPSLLLRVRTTPRPETTTTAATVRVDANGGSVSFHSTTAGPAGIDSKAMTLAANRKLVHAESHWNHGIPNDNMIPAAINNLPFQRHGQVTYTVTQL